MDVMTSPALKKPNVYTPRPMASTCRSWMSRPPSSRSPSIPPSSARSSQRTSSHQKPLQLLPRWLRRKVFERITKRSVLARALRSADAKYLSGLNTYLFGAGPDNLGTVTTDPIDRRFAEAPPLVSIRLRLQDVAQLLAEFLAPEMREPGKPLYLLNIAGGPTMDSLNALTCSNRSHPQQVRERRSSFRCWIRQRRACVRRPRTCRAECAGWSAERPADRVSPSRLRLGTSGRAGARAR